MSLNLTNLSSFLLFQMNCRAKTNSTKQAETSSTEISSTETSSTETSSTSNVCFSSYLLFFFLKSYVSQLNQSLLLPFVSDEF